MIFKKYTPHLGQEAFHYYMSVYRYLLMIAGIRSGKTYSGGYEAGKQAWNAKGEGVFGIVAPTYHMLDRTTWFHFVNANRTVIQSNNNTDKIIVLKNGRRVHGHSADRADRIRNETFVGFWVDEARECKNFGMLWDILRGRVLSTGGKGFVTTSPNSFDDIHKIFYEERKKGYGVVRFPTHTNPYLDKEAIAELEESYDEKFAKQELHGDFVIFEGAVYYAFNRKQNAGDLAFEVANYNPERPINLCCDFNVDPMAWILTQFAENEEGLAQVYAIDEIYIHNSNTIEACQEFKIRYPKHERGIVLYGDATGRARHTSSNVTNWKIIEHELRDYGITKRVPISNPSERDRINAVNGVICNSKGVRRLLVHPERCKHLIRDFEQVNFKERTSQIDKTKDYRLTHPSDAIGYMLEKEFSLNKGKITGLRI